MPILYFLGSSLLHATTTDNMLIVSNIMYMDFSLVIVSVLMVLLMDMNV